LGLVGAVGIEIASQISKPHRTKALPAAPKGNCCQMLPRQDVGWSVAPPHLSDNANSSRASRVRRETFVHPLGTIAPAPCERARATGILHLMLSIPTDYRASTLRTVAFVFSVLVFLVGETAMCPTAVAAKVKPCTLESLPDELSPRDFHFQRRHCARFP
jgi:hypothetical protein